MARYRVKINGFRVVQESYDDMLERDGKRDEVMISVVTTVTDRDGRLLGLPSERTTPIMGDTWRLDNRVQAGSASDRGGLRTGDRFPTTVAPWLPPIPTSATRDYPPYVIWEGELPDDGSRSVLIVPSLLEYDLGRDFWTEALNVVKQIDDTFGQRAKAAFSTLFPVAAPVFDAVSVGIQTAAALPRFLGSPGIRPIGMQSAPGEPDKYVYSPQVLGLNGKTAAEIAATDYGFGRPGIFSHAYKDAPGLDGWYEVYFQVEDLSVPVPAWQHIGSAFDVRAMAPWGPFLLAVTGDARLWSRTTTEVDEPWTPLGSAPVPAGMAVSGPIFCAGRDNGLYAKIEPFATPWQRIGHANSVTAMAATGGRLYCTTRDNLLWSREPLLQDVDWQRVGHANGVVAMTARGGNLVCATADRQLWTRPAGPDDVEWKPLGSAPADVGALAAIPGDPSVWVTTADGRLWKFRP
ncbi:hypothetical protein ACI8AF_17060 [Blastococcus sp. SYSU D00669]